MRGTFRIPLSYRALVAGIWGFARKRLDSLERCRHEEAILKDIVAIADDYNMSIRTAVLAERAADEAILGELERRNHNLVVMGVGRRPGDKLFFGDTAAALLEKSGALAVVRCELTSAQP
jgi:nucleotide-binding universal stress UspA family protein